MKSVVSTTSILRSFVSSHKADFFKCHSIDESTFVTIPYACAYSHSAKRGGTPHLAVATEQGTVHVMDTSKRRDWDPEPPRVTFQPHDNGIFDVKWSPSDNLLATASGDKSVRVSSFSSSGRSDDRTLHILRGHESTVKCLAWDPTSDGNILCAGGRDGSICLWDLRVGEGSREDLDEVWTASERAPVLTIPRAHEDTSNPKPKGRSRKITAAVPHKGITSLVFSDAHPYGIVSSSAFDGILHLWDGRQPTKTRKSRSTKTKARPTPLYTSSCDPTTYGGARRARGITTLASGAGPTAPYLYALSIDSRIHTYSAVDLEPLSGHTSSSSEPERALGLDAHGHQHDPYAHTHAGMQTNSFYVKLAASPCGRWLASGNAADGRAYLFDVASRSSAARARGVGAGWDEWDGAVELRGQTIGEVGAMDWAEGMLAMCGDDGTVRVWRPDAEVSRRCAEAPEEMKWEWSWAADA
ncbi:WD40 repeat-like protein [Dichomitus squalens]|uniref:WD40 repeat-like protein n=1 Tax=Dichomitus squalens TaxID=114155 RepID=A0A4Q9NX18_9APHY|nr:WD40 repeat-like protein [Dichomitus squalens]TBU64217.1 WD40 repeat-like protein [Dichomitus squalens]